MATAGKNARSTASPKAGASGPAAAAKAALVTGGASRVGRAVVEHLLQHGFDVAFTYLTSQAQAREVEGFARRFGRKAVAIRADLTQPERAAAAIARAVKKALGRLDVLVNNASLFIPATLEKSTLADSRRMFAIHYESPMLLAQKLAPLLTAAKGRIINMADLLAEKPWPDYVAYCASKAALVNLTLSLARTLAPEVSVNAIAPGVVAWAKGFSASMRRDYLKRVPLASAGTPADVARLVHFLATDGGYITGQVVRLDGGRSIT